MVPIKTQIEIVNKHIRRAERCMNAAPEGTLIVASRGKTVQYYWQTGNGMKRSYIPKKQEKLIRHLAQNEYDRSFLNAAKALLHTLTVLDEMGAKRSAQEMYLALSAPYAKLSDNRKQLVEPYVLPAGDYIKAWLEQDYEQLPMRDDMAFFITEKGDHVRSKSEKIIADKLYHEGIPYRYEERLDLDGRIVHPDFTLLNPNERTVHYFEHFGMMDDPKYCDKALSKISNYVRCGYRLGREFLCTFESDNQPVDIKSLDLVLRNCFSTE